MNSQETGFSYPPGAIVNQIQTLLGERYKEGFPIIKEVLQNANDGGATRLDIGVTPGFKDNSLHPQLRQPALFFVNNGSFRDEDSQAIGWIGVDFNAGDSSKIGKFGLGQKSIFHFCEAFFYVAFSEHLSKESASYRFLTPWADGNPMSDLDKLAVENYLKNIFLKQKNDYSDYFILWLPLRVSNQHRCILPNIYDCQTIQEHFPSDASIKIGKLLPLLNSLESIHYWIPDDRNNLIESFKVEIEDSQQRFSYPKAGDNFCEVSLLQNLSGSIRVSTSTKMSYAGIEATLSEEVFYPLMVNTPDEYEARDHFWSTLSNLTNWPKRSTYDQTKKPKVVPDKAVPHCGAIFLRYPSDKANSNLTLQWAVFLPLEEIEEDNLIHEEIPIHSIYEYTLVLHGYFFLDSGRRSIEGITQIYEGRPNIEKPKNKDGMIQGWNYILATEGTLSNVLKALEAFSQNPGVEDSDISSVCLGLLRSKLFQQSLLHPYLYKSGYWIYQVKRDSIEWRLVSHNRILSLPGIPNWEVWTELERIATHADLILKAKPNLLPYNKPDQWNDDEITRTLTSLDILQVFQDSNELIFLTEWLDIIAQNDHDEKFSDDVQDLLQEKLQIILTQSDWTDFEETTKTSFFTSIIPRLNKSRWFCLDTSDIALFKYLNEVQDKILLLPQYLSPEDSSNNLSENNAARLISGFIEYREQSPKNSSIKFIVLQIVQAIKENEGSIFREKVKNIPFIPGYNCRDNRVKFYSLNDIDNYNDYILRDLFYDNKSHNELAKALQNTLANKDVILIDQQLARELYIDLVECNYETCFKILGQRPSLANPKNRIDLLKQLLHGHDFQALRFLLHGYSEHYENRNSLYIASQKSQAWSKIARCILEDWQIVPQELAQIIPPDRWGDLEISSISPENLIRDLQHLDPSQLNLQDFTTEERQEILKQVSAYGTQKLWKSLPLHTAITGSIVSITDNTYLNNSHFSLPSQLESHVVLIEKTNRPDWIQQWEPKAAIATILKLSDPEQYCNLLLELIPKIANLKEDNELIILLKEVAWLPLETGGKISPSRVILLPNQYQISSFKDRLQSAFQNEKSPYVSRSMLAEDVLNSQALEVVCEIWYYNAILRFLLRESQNPSDHVALILDVLTSLEQHNQSLSNEIKDCLKITPWLVDKDNQPRSPEQIINLPGLEDSVKEILSSSNPRQYISFSMLREEVRDKNILSSQLISEWFTSGEDAFEKLGEIVSSQSRHYLGDIDLNTLGDKIDFVEKLYSTLKDCEETFILKLAQDFEAFYVFIFERLLKPIDNCNRITNILNYVTKRGNKPNRTEIKIFNIYLGLACELNEFSSMILPNINLLNKNKEWKDPILLCDGSNNYNISSEYILDSDQRDILADYLNQITVNTYILQESEQTSLNSGQIQSDNDFSNNSRRLEEYFKPWLQYIPSQAIGGIIALLAGSNHNVLQLAQSFLQRRPVEDLRDELLFGDLKSKDFSIQINEGETQAVQSILGDIFQAPVASFENLETIFLGTINSSDSMISLRRIDLQQLNREKAEYLLFQSFMQLMNALDKNGYSANRSRIENTWERLNSSKQIEIEVAKDFILSNSKYLLRSLGVENSEIKEKLKLWS
ncbi:hypothetical protein NON20_25830 (plasmid) [Synechocystis sp. B12]|nr:hypothetical protein NON20_25830 [Synechocystis sp. B12]